MAEPDPQQEEPRAWLRLHAAAQAYGIPYQRLYKWYRRGLARGRRAAGRAVLLDATSIEEQLLPPGWEWLSEALARCGLGRYAVLRLIHEGRLRARKVRQRWQVETASLAACARERAIPPAGWGRPRPAGAWAWGGGKSSGASGPGNCAPRSAAGAGPSRSLPLRSNCRLPVGSPRRRPPGGRDGPAARSGCASRREKSWPARSASAGSWRREAFSSRLCRRGGSRCARPQGRRGWRSGRCTSSSTEGWSGRGKSENAGSWRGGVSATRPRRQDDAICAPPDAVAQ